MARTPGPRRTTLREVAAGARVSVATVSRVLNGSPAVTKATQARVQAVMDELNFAPSAAARALNSGRSRTVGAIVPTLDHAIFARFLDSLERRLAEHQLSLVVATTGGDAVREAEQAASLLNIGAEALIVSGLDHRPDLDESAHRFGVPIIATSCHNPDARYPTIGYDNAAIMRLGLDHLDELGHRAVAVIHGPTADNDRTVTRLQAVADDSRFEVTYHEVALDVGGGALAATEIMADRNGAGPTAIFCLSDALALGALFELQRAGIEIPTEMSLIGVGDIEWTQVANPPLTTVCLPVARMGFDAADALHGALDLDQAVEPVLLNATLTVRGTTGIRR